jgi:hypothetical protein
VWSKLIGNAVPPLLGEAIAGAVMDEMNAAGSARLDRATTVSRQLSLLDLAPSTGRAARA